MHPPKPRARGPGTPPSLHARRPHQPGYRVGASRGLGVITASHPSPNHRALGEPSGQPFRDATASGPWAKSMASTIRRAPGVNFNAGSRQEPVLVMERVVHPNGAEPGSVAPTG